MSLRREDKSTVRLPSRMLASMTFRPASMESIQTVTSANGLILARCDSNSFRNESFSIRSLVTSLELQAVTNRVIARNNEERLLNDMDQNRDPNLNLFLKP